MLPHVKEYYKELEQRPDIAKQHKAILKYFDMEKEFIISEVSPIRVSFRSKTKPHFIITHFIKVSIRDSSHKINISYSNDFFGDDFSELISKYDETIDGFKEYIFDCVPEKMEEIHRAMKHTHLMFTDKESVEFKKNQFNSYVFQYKSKDEIEKEHSLSFHYYFSYPLFEMKNIIDFTINYFIESEYNILLHKDDLNFIKSILNSKQNNSRSIINLKYKNQNPPQHNTFFGDCINLVDENIIKEFLHFDENRRISNESKELFKINHQI